MKKQTFTMEQFLKVAPDFVWEPLVKNLDPDAKTPEEAKEKALKEYGGPYEKTGCEADIIRYTTWSGMEFWVFHVSDYGGSCLPSVFIPTKGWFDGESTEEPESVIAQAMILWLSEEAKTDAV